MCDVCIVIFCLANLTATASQTLRGVLESRCFSRGVSLHTCFHSKLCVTFTRYGTRSCSQFCTIWVKNSSATFDKFELIIHIVQNVQYELITHMQVWSIRLTDGQTKSNIWVINSKQTARPNLPLLNIWGIYSYWIFCTRDNLKCNPDRRLDFSSSIFS